MEPLGGDLINLLTYLIDSNSQFSTWQFKLYVPHGSIFSFPARDSKHQDPKVQSINRKVGVKSSNNLITVNAERDLFVCLMSWALNCLQSHYHSLKEVMQKVHAMLSSRKRHSCSSATYSINKSKGCYYQWSGSPTCDKILGSRYLWWTLWKIFQHLQYPTLL